jgi:ketosteroid isomerase-like protein
MHDEDLEALRRGYEAWNRGDVGAVLELVDPEIDWRPGEDAPESSGSGGREGFRRFIVSWTESFEELQIEPRELTVAGDHVIVVVDQRGRGRGSGIELDISTVHVWRVRDGRAVGWYAFRSREEALEAVGM